MRVLTKLKKLKPGRIIGGALGLLLVLSLLFALGSPALAFPQLAHRFDGSVAISGQPAPEVEVSATIAGVDEVFTATTDAEGAYHLLYVLGDDLDTPDKEGGVNGDEIEFYVGDVYVTSYTFESGASDTLNLIVPDTTVPTVTIDDIADYVKVLAQISGTASDNVALDKVQVSIENTTDSIFWNGTAWLGATEVWLDATGTETWTYTMPALTSGENYQVRAKAIDTSTNESTVASDSFTFDTVEPVVSITIADPVNAANVGAVAVTITSDEDGTYIYTISDGSDEVTATGDISAGVDIVLDPDLSSLADGEITADASVEDAAGNTGDATPDTATKDTVAPVVEITAPSEGALLNSLEVTIVGTATEVDEVTVYGSGVVPVVDGVFSITLIYDDEGAKSIPVTATDAAGNVGSDTVNFTIDVTPPAVTIAPVNSPTNNTTQTLIGDRHEGATVVLTSAEATCGVVTDITTTTWSCDVTLVEGSNVITATADTSTATATILLDTVAPTVESTTPEAEVIGVAVGTTVSVTFSEAMDESTITTDSFTLNGVSGAVSYDANTATFTPSADLVYNTAYAATLSTAITDAAGNPLVEYSWSFTTAQASLGDLIDEILAAGEDTLELPAGTYSGDITIDEPITITGIEGETIISGGIHVAPLTGSNVTIENLTITDYTDYGIWIELVGADDAFTIFNNTILGVEGSLIGIQVDEVEAGGTLNIEQNSISGNDTGIKLLANVVDSHVSFNNIVGNEVGLELLVLGEHMVGAPMNWWGDISGPEEGNENPSGTGDKIELTDGLGYQPWLTREFQTVLDDNIAYFGYAWVWLYTGWNIMSTPVALDPAADTWGEYVTLGDGLDIHATSPAYRFDALNQEWVLLTDDDALEPGDAIYVRMASDDTAPILYSPNLSVPSKELYSGWNLVSLAWLDPEVYGMPANEALVTVEEVTGGLNGYKLVVSPGMNPHENSWIYIAGSDIDPWTDPDVWPPPDGWMCITSGYWVFMLNDGTLAGFTFTPISLW